MEQQKVRERLASLITMFSRCRLKQGTASCPECQFFEYDCLFINCPLRAEHNEYDTILSENRAILMEGTAPMQKLLPPDVLRELRKID